jgi:hypothetical protein
VAEGKIKAGTVILLTINYIATNKQRETKTAFDKQG